MSIRTSETKGRWILTVSDPFELAGLAIRGDIIAREIDGKCRLLLAPLTPVEYLGIPYGHIVLKLRHKSDTNSVNGIGLSGHDVVDEPGWGVDRWRGGGLAIIGSLTDTRSG